MRDRLLEQALELHLRPRAARLDIRQYAVERVDVVRHAARELAHLPEGLIDALQLGGDGLEGAVQPLVERGGQLLIHRGAHLLELFLVAHHHVVHGIAEHLALAAGILRVIVPDPGEGLAERVRHMFQLARGILPLLLKTACVLVPAVGEFAAQGVDQLAGLLLQRGDLPLQPGDLLLILPGILPDPAACAPLRNQ